VFFWYVTLVASPELELELELELALELELELALELELELALEAVRCVGGQLPMRWGERDLWE
jgi:hypothetical protein